MNLKNFYLFKFPLKIMTTSTKKHAIEFKEKLGLKYFPVGMYYADTKPQNAAGFKTPGSGCIIPLIFSASKGKTVAFDATSTGYMCSAFYLGYKEWVFDGIECFLSDGSVFGRKPERFIKTAKQAKEFVESLKPEKINDKVTVFKPLEEFSENESPKIVIFFVNADEISGLVYLLHFNQPEKDDVVVTRFMSGCGAVVTIPMKYKNEGIKKAVWGMHDISARLRIPKDLMTLAMPYKMFVEMCEETDNSFIICDDWAKIKERISVQR